MSAQDVTSDFLKNLRQQFFPDDPKKYFQQKDLLLKAITYPAKWLQARGVTLPEKRYREILADGVIKGIKQKGNTAEIKHFGHYLYTCIQKHMDIHGHKYYQEGTEARNRAAVTLSQIVAGNKGQPDSVEVMAEIHAVLSARKPKRNPKTGVAVIQNDLFYAPAKPLQAASKQQKSV